MTLVPQHEGFNLNTISLETSPSGRIVKASVETYAGVLEIGVTCPGPFNASMTLNFIPSPTPEEFTDSERLDAWLMNPSKLWTANSDGGGTQYCGNGRDWHRDQRDALNDLVRSLRVEQSDGAQTENAAATFSKANTPEQMKSESSAQPC